jgi:lipopolysaccharide transport system permease protein
MSNSHAPIPMNSRTLLRNKVEYIIEPSHGWLCIPWREIIHYRDLLFLLVRRDFISRYKQTILGPLWFVIQPLLTTAVFTVIFDKVAGISTDRLPPVLFYMCGLLAWGYFAQCMGGTSTTFVSNAGLFGKVYFPRLIIPLSVVISNLMSFAIQLVTFLVFWCWFKFFTNAGQLFHVTTYLFALPVLLLLTAGIGLGVGLWMSALTAKYRDFSHLAGFLTQLWMFATPIVYPLSEVPQRWQWVCALNPMTGIVEAYRYALLGAGTIQPVFLAISIIGTVFLLITGALVFVQTERTFIDTV